MDAAHQLHRHGNELKEWQQETLHQGKASEVPILLVPPIGFNSSFWDFVPLFNGLYCLNNYVLLILTILYYRTNQDLSNKIHNGYKNHYQFREMTSFYNVRIERATINSIWREYLGNTPFAKNRNKKFLT